MDQSTEKKTLTDTDRTELLAPKLELKIEELEAQAAPQLSGDEGFMTGTSVVFPGAF